MSIIPFKAQNVGDSIANNLTSAYFYQKQRVFTINTNEVCASDIINSVIFDIGVQSYSDIN